MGTRSVVAQQVGDGWAGRYIHWDGYPEGVGAVLWTEVTEVLAGDWQEAVRQFVRPDVPPEGGYWSSLGECQEWQDGNGGGWVKSWGDDMGAMYAYLLNATGLTVFERRRSVDSPTRAISAFGFPAAPGGIWAILGQYRWDGPPPPFVA